MDMTTWHAFGRRDGIVVVGNGKGERHGLSHSAGFIHRLESPPRRPHTLTHSYSHILGLYVSAFLPSVLVCWAFSPLCFTFFSISPALGHGGV